MYIKWRIESIVLVQNVLKRWLYFLRVNTQTSLWMLVVLGCSVQWTARMPRLETALSQPWGTRVGILYTVIRSSLYQVCKFLVFSLFLAGVQCGGCSKVTIRLRPALVFQPRHVEIYLNTLDSVLGSMWRQLHDHTACISCGTSTLILQFTLLMHHAICRCAWLKFSSFVYS